MHWKAKAHVLAVLSRVPGGRFLYHRLQQIAGTNPIDAQRDMGRAFELVDLIHESGETVDGARMVEIGTGWHPFAPMLFALGGAQSITTIDVNPWLTVEATKESWIALEPYLTEIAVRLDQREEDVRARYDQVSVHAETLPEILDPLGIRYVYPGDARQTGLESASVDIVFSSNVLEHIPHEIQTEIHTESLRILRPDGLSVHRFNPQDHYSTVDSSITHSNFLRYSSQEWHWYGGSGLAYHNRLRGTEYVELFEELGFEVSVYRDRVDARSQKAIETGSLIVADEFRRFSPRDLAVDYVWLACRKPITTPDSSTGQPKRPSSVTV